MRSLIVCRLSLLVICGAVSACGSSAENLPEKNLALSTSQNLDNTSGPDNAAKEVDQNREGNNSAVASTSRCAQADNPPISSNNIPIQVNPYPAPNGLPSPLSPTPTVRSAPMPRCPDPVIEAVPAQHHQFEALPATIARPPEAGHS